MTFEVLGDLSDKEKESLEAIMKVLHERIKNYPKLKRLVYTVKGEPNFFYKIRGFYGDEVVIGLNSNSFTGNKNTHILMADIDLKNGITPDLNKKNMTEIQREFDLPNVYRYKSSKDGLFVLCFTELEWDELLHITAKIKHCDQNHKMFLIKNGFATLRITAKKDKPSQIQYYDTIEHKSKTRKELVGAKEIFDDLWRKNAN